MHRFALIARLPHPNLRGQHHKERLDRQRYTANEAFGLNVVGSYSRRYDETAIWYLFLPFHICLFFYRAFRYWTLTDPTVEPIHVKQALESWKELAEPVKKQFVCLLLVKS
jgi:hypothetical protein